MSLFTHSSLYVGIEHTSNGLRMASLVKKSKGWEIAYLRKVLWEDNVNPLDKVPSDAIISTALSCRDVLVRGLEVPLKKEKDILAALPFQVEPLLPYPVEKCILQKTNIQEFQSGTLLTIFSTKTETLQSHLQHWKSFSIDPDIVTCSPQALAALSTLAPASDDPQLILHLGEKEGTCALVDKGKVLAARPVAKDLHDIQKTFLAITTSLKSKKIESFLFVGEDIFFAEKIQEASEKKVIYFKIPSISDENIQKFGFAIGIAMAGGEEKACNFRENELCYTTSWKKIKKPFFTFCIAASLLFISSFSLAQFLIHKQEKRIEKEFLGLLAHQGKKEEGKQSNESIRASLFQLEKEIQARPDTFPLLPIIPKVSDLLAWLSTHPHFNRYEDVSLGIENFHYILEKRPEFTNRQEHYLVKIEMEFSTTNPAIARAFHESLLAPNPFVDAKKEIQWVPGKNKHYISFYAKDKTRYY